MTLVHLFIQGNRFKFTPSFAISKGVLTDKTAAPGESCRTKNGVKAFTFCTRSAYKSYVKPLIFTTLKINLLKICPNLTIFLNTYSYKRIKQRHGNPKKPAKPLSTNLKRLWTTYDRKKSFSQKAFFDDALNECAKFIYRSFATVFTGSKGTHSPSETPGSPVWIYLDLTGAV